MAKIANVALTNTFDTWRVRSNEAFDRLSQFAIDNSKLYANTLTANVSFVSRGNAVFAGSTSNTLVRITQTGTGNALLVEDSANPDSNPFVIDTNGRVLVGTATVITTAALGTAYLQVTGDGNERPQISVSRFSADTDRPRFTFIKSRSASVGTNTIVQSGDSLGEINFLGADGSGSTGYPIAAQIASFVDGSPGTNDMPGRLTFSTTADGASTPTERMRIDNAGDVGIGTTNPTARLNVVDATSQDAVRITQTGAGNALVVEDEANPDSTPFVVTSTGSVGVGTSSPVSALHVVDALSGGQLIVTNSQTNNGEKYGTFATQHYTNAEEPALGIATQSNATDNNVLIGGALGEFNAATSVIFYTAANNITPTGTERMRIASTGQITVGAGTVSAPVIAPTGDTNTGVFFPAADTIAFAEGGVEIMRVDSTGRVGIGTTTPAATLDVAGTVSVAKANILSQTLTDGATINWDTSSGQVATVTLGGNRTIAAPTNLKVGTYILHVIQDGTGSKTLTWNSVFKWTAGVAPPLTTTANARDVFSFVSDGTNLYGSFLPDVR
jgi:hypothetical protein